MFPDLKAPRFSPKKFRKHIVTKELYNKWKAETGHKISYKEYKAIWKLIALEYNDVIVEETDGANLPHGLGLIYMGYVKHGRKLLDYHESRKHNLGIYHENFQTDGKSGKIIYAPCGKYTIKYCGWWSFTAHTNFKKRCSDGFFEYPERYKNTKEKVYKNVKGWPINIRDEGETEACEC